MTLPGRPAPHLISFAPECFELTGETRTEYVVVMSAPRYPQRFDNLTDAAAFATRCGRSVETRTSAVSRRVRWS